MAGRKLSQQPVGGEIQDSAGSKFRRKISNGLASITNTLSARKTTPGRQLVLHPPLAVTSPTAQHDAPLSPSPKPKPVSIHSIDSTTQIAVSAPHESPTKRIETDATPKALPRSRTTSFLPRPVRLDIDASSTDLERTAKAFSPQLVTDPVLRAVPSKIPTPSPPPTERRVISPRQYLSHYTSMQGKPTETGYVRMGNAVRSPSKATPMSRTTSSLVNAARSPQAAGFMAPRRPGVRRPLTSPPVQKPVLQENIPTSQRNTPRYSQTQMQEKTPRPASLAVPLTSTPKRSFGPTSPISQSKQSNRGTPPTARKRMSSNLAPHTPTDARRAYPSEQVVPNAQESASVVGCSSILQPRLMGPRNVPTPIPLSAGAAGAGARPTPSRSNTDKDLQRKTLGTPNGLGGVWRSSRALAAANHEVRLPRSSTFHNFGRRWEAAPPVPPIPDQYRIPSLSHLLRSSLAPVDNSNRSGIIKMVSDTASCASIPEEVQPELDMLVSTAYALTSYAASSSSGLSDTSDDLVALLPLPRGAESTTVPPLSYSQSSQTSLQRSSDKRPWSLSELHSENSADVEPHLQVRDYMPPLYWAGRFQSRYDQWRTEAMQAELNPQHRTQGQLGQCRLTQEKIAACYIFAQLRDLCLTGQAADSLWVSEFFHV